MNKSIIALVAVLVLGGIAYFAFTSMNTGTYQPAPANENGMPATTTTTGTTTTTTTTAVKTTMVSYQGNSFSPNTIEVNAGDTVTFVNNHTATIRIASNPHPAHTSYPALDSDNLQPNGSYSITFPQAITINYHNHFNPGVTGTIIVK